MAVIRGRLLVGGLTLKNLSGVLETESECACAGWTGHLLIDPPLHENIQPGRPYRMELEDGRAGQVVVQKVEGLPGERRLKAVFEGQSALQPSTCTCDSHGFTTLCAPPIHDDLSAEILGHIPAVTK